MKTIKFRIIKTQNSEYKVQVKKWWGWLTKKSVTGGADQTWLISTLYKTEEEAIARVIKDEKLKPEVLTLIQYPTLKIINN